MMKRNASVAAVVVGVALLAGVAASAATPSGAAAAFLEAWAKVPSYTDTIKAHETKGTDVQDRIYHYAYLKPRR